MLATTAVAASLGFLAVTRRRLVCACPDEAPITLTPTP